MTPPPAAHAIEHRAVLYQDVRIELFACGRGPLVVMLPSLGRDSEDFHDLAMRLAQAGYRSVCPSPRGLGGSVGPLGGITLHDFARDAARVIEAEGAAPAVVVGHAFGNWVARTAATDYPGLVRAVVLLAAGRKGATDPSIGAAITTCFDGKAPIDARMQALRHAFFAPGNDPSIWLDGWDPEIARAERAAAARTPHSEWWHAGTVPVLDLQAADDALLPRDQGAKLRDELGERVTIEVIANAGHALLPEQPAAVARALLAYLRAISP